MNNLGEAGIGAWLDAIESRFSDWRLCISSRLTDSEYDAGNAIDRVCHLENARFDDALHLAVSMRSFRAENVSAFVKPLLDCERDGARAAAAELRGRYPIALTRDLGLAKAWVRDRARGSERFGLVASSKAMRLKPHAIDIRVDVDPVKWFLNSREDTRSSFYLEDAATEFSGAGSGAGLDHGARFASEHGLLTSESAPKYATYAPRPDDLVPVVAKL